MYRLLNFLNFYRNRNCKSKPLKLKGFLVSPLTALDGVVQRKPKFSKISLKLPAMQFPTFRRKPESATRDPRHRSGRFRRWPWLWRLCPQRGRWSESKPRRPRLPLGRRLGTGRPNRQEPKITIRAISSEIKLKILFFSSTLQCIKST